MTGGGRKIQGPCCTTIGLTGALVHCSRYVPPRSLIKLKHIMQMHVNVEILRTCGFIILNGQEPEKSASNQKLDIFIWCFLMRKSISGADTTRDDSWLQHPCRCSRCHGAPEGDDSWLDWLDRRLRNLGVHTMLLLVLNEFNPINTDGSRSSILAGPLQ